MGTHTTSSISCTDPENFLGGGVGVQLQTRVGPTKFYDTGKLSGVWTTDPLLWICACVYGQNITNSSLSGPLVLINTALMYVYVNLCMFDVLNTESNL